MAIALKRFIPPPPAPEPEYEVTLTLSKDEARVLAGMLALVAGDPYSTWRSISSGIGRALYPIVPYPELPCSYPSGLMASGPLPQ